MPLNKRTTTVYSGYIILLIIIVAFMISKGKSYWGSSIGVGLIGITALAFFIALAQPRIRWFHALPKMRKPGEKLERKGLLLKLKEVKFRERARDSLTAVANLTRKALGKEVAEEEKAVVDKEAPPAEDKLEELKKAIAEFDKELAGLRTECAEVKKVIKEINAKKRRLAKDMKQFKAYKRRQEKLLEDKRLHGKDTTKVQKVVQKLGVLVEKMKTASEKDVTTPIEQETEKADAAIARLEEIDEKIKSTEAEMKRLLDETEHAKGKKLFNKLRRPLKRVKALNTKLSNQVNAHVTTFNQVAVSQENLSTGIERINTKIEELEQLWKAERIMKLEAERATLVDALDKSSKRIEALDQAMEEVNEWVGDVKGVVDTAGSELAAARKLAEENPEEFTRILGRSADKVSGVAKDVASLLLTRQMLAAEEKTRADAAAEAHSKAEQQLSELRAEQESLKEERDDAFKKRNKANERIEELGREIQEKQAAFEEERQAKQQEMEQEGANKAAIQQDLEEKKGDITTLRQELAAENRKKTEAEQAATRSESRYSQVSDELVEVQQESNEFQKQAEAFQKQAEAAEAAKESARAELATALDERTAQYKEFSTMFAEVESRHREALEQMSQITSQARQAEQRAEIARQQAEESAEKEQEAREALAAAEQKKETDKEGAQAARAEWHTQMEALREANANLREQNRELSELHQKKTKIASLAAQEVTGFRMQIADERKASKDLVERMNRSVKLLETQLQEANTSVRELKQAKEEVEQSATEERARTQKRVTEKLTGIEVSVKREQEALEAQAQQEQAAAVQAVRDKYDQRIAAEKERITSLEEQLEEARESVRQETDRAKESERMRIAAAEELAETQRLIGEDRASLEQDARESRDAAAESESKLNKTREELSSTETELNALSTKLEEVQEEIAGLNTRIEEATQAKEAAELSASEKGKVIEEKDDIIRRRDELIEQRDTKIQEQARLIETRSQGAQRVSQLYENLKSEHAELLEANSKAAADAANARASLQLEIQRHRNEVGPLKQKLSQLEPRNQELESQIQQVANLVAEHPGLKTEVESLTAELESTKAQRQAAQKELEQTQRDLQQAQEELGHLESLQEPEQEFEPLPGIPTLPREVIPTPPPEEAPPPLPEGVSKEDADMAAKIEKDRAAADATAQYFSVVIERITSKLEQAANPSTPRETALRLVNETISYILTDASTVDLPEPMAKELESYNQQALQRKRELEAHEETMRMHVPQEPESVPEEPKRKRKATLLGAGVTAEEEMPVEEAMPEQVAVLEVMPDPEISYELFQVYKKDEKPPATVQQIILDPDKEEISFGRESKKKGIEEQPRDVVIGGELTISISRDLFRIGKEGDRYTLTVGESMNAILINGNPVKPGESAYLNHDDTILIHESHISLKFMLLTAENTGKDFPKLADKLHWFKTVLELKKGLSVGIPETPEKAAASEGEDTDEETSVTYGCLEIPPNAIGKVEGGQIITSNTRVQLNNQYTIIGSPGKEEKSVMKEVTKEDGSTETMNIPLSKINVDVETGFKFTDLTKGETIEAKKRIGRHHTAIAWNIKKHEYVIAPDPDGEHKVFVNYEEVTEPRRKLLDGDVIHIGDNEPVFFIFRIREFRSSEKMEWDSIGVLFKFDELAKCPPRLYSPRTWS
jgi:chromosome segregation ATPase/pSer/pThr/pTyr-binding forkhead associated (FHA) protein